MEGDPNQVDISLVVEWENSRHTIESRTSQMMHQLAQQVERRLAEGEERFELIVVYDPGDSPEASIQSMLDKHWAHLLARVSTKTAMVPDGSYYVMKNVAASMAKGDILVFIDCDVLPEPNWLENILAPFADAEIGVSQGATYVQPYNTFTKGLALAWLFPLKNSSGELSEEGRVIANNIAFRRSIFLRFPYPDLPTWRGQCTAQRNMLDKHEVRVHWSGTARTIHPFPVGPSGILERACLNGHDHAKREYMEGAEANWRASYWRFISLVKRARSRRERMRDDLALSSLGEWVCTLVAVGYWGVACISECGLHLFPTSWPKLFRELPRNSNESQIAVSEK